MSAPIYVADKIVLEESISPDKTGEADIEKFKKFIEDLKPSDFNR